MRVTQPLSGSIDGIQLDHFEVGEVYDMGTSLANYLMAIRAADPVADESPAKIVPLDQPALLNEIRENARKGKLIALAADRPPRKRKGKGDAEPA